MGAGFFIPKETNLKRRKDLYSLHSLSQHWEHNTTAEVSRDRRVIEQPPKLEAQKFRRYETVNLEMRLINNELTLMTKPFSPQLQDSY